MPAKGLPKNLALTLWLLAPLAVVALLCWWIFYSFAAGPKMNAPARGQGAADTGGANALGELLAGNDPNQIQRENRLLREGKLTHPADWPGGLRLTIPDAGLDPTQRRPSIWFQQSDLQTHLRVMIHDEGLFTLDIPQGDLAANTTLLLGINGLKVNASTTPPTATDGEGNPATAITLPIIPPGDTARDEPLIINLTELGVTFQRD